MLDSVSSTLRHSEARNLQTRDAHFPTGNRETGNYGPGNFPREIGDREIGKNREKISHFLCQKWSKNLEISTKILSDFWTKLITQLEFVFLFGLVNFRYLIMKYFHYILLLL